MALAADAKQTGIQMKHVLITAIVIVSILLIIGSVVMITIGYLNPFGTVGLGILGGGCVLYFSAILFLCTGSIWVKNRYYADENDFGEKWSPSSTEDISFLKPASNVTSPTINETGYKNETERPWDDNNMVPLYSVSTVYSSVSSSVSTVPDKTILCNWQGYDAEGAMDCDVFSSSLTAMQHSDMKLQEKLKLKQESTEQICCESTAECKIKEAEKRKTVDLPVFPNTEKSVSDTPRQRKPVVMDIVGTSYFSIEEKQLMNDHFNGKSKEIKNTNTNSQTYNGCNVSDIYERKATHELPKIYSQECKPALENWKIRPGEKDNQRHDRRWCVISEEYSWIHTPKVQDRTSKGLNTVPETISEAEKMHRSCEKLHKNNQDRTEILMKNLPPKALRDQSEKVQLSSQVTTSETLNTKGKLMMKPGFRKGF